MKLNKDYQLRSIESRQHACNSARLTNHENNESLSSNQRITLKGFLESS
jgi:hypothetical protein